MSTWAAIATSPCCDYEGLGASCGDAVCTDDKAGDSTDGKVKIQLGGGTLSKMPAVDFTDQPRANEDGDSSNAGASLGDRKHPCFWCQLALHCANRGLCR